MIVSHRDEFVADLQAWLSYLEDIDPATEHETTELAVLQSKIVAILRDEFGVVNGK